MWFWKSKKLANDDTANGGRISITAFRLTDDRTFKLFLVGESNYQGALRSISGGHQEDGVKVEKLALLVPEPANNFDKNAVFAMIDDKKVGYLSRDDAIEFHKSMKGVGKFGQIAAVDALINGGFTKKDGTKAHFGVRLDLSFPFKK